MPNTLGTHWNDITLFPTQGNLLRSSVDNNETAGFHAYLINFAGLLEKVFSWTFNVNREVSLDKQ